MPRLFKKFATAVSVRGINHIDISHRLPAFSNNAANDPIATEIPTVVLVYAWKFLMYNQKNGDPSAQIPDIIMDDRTAPYILSEISLTGFL
jgi:hypothetical protein